MGRLLLATVVTLSLIVMTVGATIGGFSDTETSEDNYFETADLDITVAKADSLWQPGDFEDDLPHGAGVASLFNVDHAVICQYYYSYTILQNTGYLDGMAYLHFILAEDIAGIADTTSVQVGYDADGNQIIAPGEIQTTTLAALDCNPLLLGVLPGGELRRLQVTIHPNVAPGEPTSCFNLLFDTEFQLLQIGDEDCDGGYSDTETCSNCLAGCSSQGCSFGYWKTHTVSWVYYWPSKKVKEVFPELALHDSYNSIEEKTMEEAFDFGGGSGALGGAKILLKQAVPAVLNAKHPGVSYPRSHSNIILDVNAALATETKSIMVALAGALEADNTLGCPLN